MQNSIEDLSKLVKEIGFNTVSDKALQRLLDKHKDGHEVVMHLINLEPHESLSELSLERLADEREARGGVDKTRNSRQELKLEASPGRDASSGHEPRSVLGSSAPREMQRRDSPDFDLDREQRDATSVDLSLNYSFLCDSAYADLLENECHGLCATPEQSRGAVIYYRADERPPEACERRQIVDLFKAEAVSYVEFDLTDDSEQTGLITAKLNGRLTLPVVFVSDKLVGGINEVKQQMDQIKYECAKQLVHSVTLDEYQHLNAISNSSVRLGIIDRALNMGETVLNYINPLFWLQSRHEAKDPDSQIEEFTITQMNWYLRNQKRILRFGSDTFLKIHPDTRQVRAVCSYDKIKSIRRAGDKLTLLYEDGHKDQFIAPEEVLNHLVALFRVRCGPSLKS
ncbi:uncharacterized protein LOC126315240 isoform X2 [Schistocerca gregaria]|uniref:uncharacterized protein LOC126315240 isoform X2 n=1 Tax=Schistocerca gregaria TaxID=7010 RepID=UPI00211EB6B3|nr:uncharacterized protein LOC126315240 isoform X2 [Schistocerca gregaria]